MFTSYKKHYYTALTTVIYCFISHLLKAGFKHRAKLNEDFLWVLDNQPQEGAVLKSRLQMQKLKNDLRLF